MTFLKPILALSNNLILIAIGIIGIGFIIGFHELGHFLFGKLFKIKTPAFAVGFGPKIYKKKIGETDFSIGIIPLGGYVESDKESFESKPYWQKLCVMAGGISFNLMFAYIVFCLLFAFGLPKTKFLYPINAKPTITIKEDYTQKEELRLISGDKIIAVNGKSIDEKPLNFYTEIKNLLNIDKNLDKNDPKYSEKVYQNAPKQITLTIERPENISLNKINKPENANAKTENNNNPTYDMENIVPDATKKTKTIEISIDTKTLVEALNKSNFYFELSEPTGVPFFEAIKEGISLTNKHIMASLYMFKHMIVNKDTSGLGGPIAIISETVKSAGQGVRMFFLLLAIISVSLAIINLIPLPILDGGQALLYTIEAIIRRRLSEKTKEVIFMISWIFMLILFVLISARDIWNIAKTFMTKK